MRALVTGGSGYLGSHLIEALAARSDVDEVINVDVRAPAASRAGVRFVERSVTEDLRPVMEGVGLAVHNAWVLDPLHDTARQRAICIGGTRQFLESCAAARVPHVVFISSDTAFGADPDCHVRVDEAAPLSERYHFQYSREKREAEGLVRRFAEERPETLVQIVRPVIVWGAHVRNFLSRLASRPFTFRVLGHDPEIQVVHEDDAAAAIAAIAGSRLPGAFHVAPPGLPLSEIFRRMGVPAIPLPLSLLVPAAELAWRLRLRWLSEAPGEFVYFLAFHPFLSSRRLVDEVGFRFRYDTPSAIDAWLGARRAGAAAVPGRYS